LTNNYPSILTTAQGAELVGLHPQVVRLMAREGRLPAHRHEGQRAFVFFTAEVLEWLKLHPASTTPEAE
jgi:excisionase family DNA binding protein